MKILVVGDSKKNKESAVLTLKGQNVTVVGSYDKAIKLLRPGCKYKVLMTELMFPMILSQYEGQEEMMAYGFVLAFHAAMVGIKYIAVVSNVAWYHPLTIACSRIAGFNSDESGVFTEEKVPKFIINASKTLFIHAPCGTTDWGKILETLKK